MRTLKNYENKSRGTPDFPCTLYRVDRQHPEFTMPLHWHAEYELILVRSGCLELTADEMTLSLTAGDVAFLADGVLHGGIPSDEDCLYECVVFSGDLLAKNIRREEIQAVFGHRRTVRRHLNGDVFPKVSTTTTRLCDHLLGMTPETDAGAHIKAIGIFTELFGELLSAAAITEGHSEGNRYILRLKHVLSYIDEHYAERITLDELAEVAGVNPKYLCRIFEALTGETPIAYIGTLRVDMAMRALRETNLPLPDIAMACGFGDQSYMAKQFKRATGMTPGAYRRAEQLGGIND